MKMKTNMDCLLLLFETIRTGDVGKWRAINIDLFVMYVQTILIVSCARENDKSTRESSRRLVVTTST